MTLRQNRGHWTAGTPSFPGLALGAGFAGNVEFLLDKRRQHAVTLRQNRGHWTAGTPSVPGLALGAGFAGSVELLLDSKARVSDWPAR